MSHIEIPNMMKSQLLTLFLFAFTTLFAQPEVRLYVSPTGSDNAPGTIEHPFATLDKAWQTAENLPRTQAITIYCREGIHYLSAPIRITSKTSGSPECPIRFLAYPGEHATISTSKRLKNLHWTAYKGRILQTSIKENLIFDQLFVNGQQQPMARYPNRDIKTAIFHGYSADAIASEHISRWQNPTRGFIHAMHSREWGGYQYIIKGKTAQGELILGGGYQNNRQMGMHPEYRMVENIFEELDSEGEWYFDATSKILYFYPPEDMNLETAIFETPQSESIFILQGDKENPVKNVELKELELTQTLRTFMKTEEPLLRSDWKIYRGGAILVENAEDCNITDCYIHHIGGNAIFFSNYNRRHTVQKNHIAHIGASAICFVGSPQAVRSPLFEYGESQNWEKIDHTPGPLTNNYPMSCKIDDNLIHSIGETEKQGAGIQISMSRRITISRNSIYDLPRAGININEGTWGGHLIENNDVFNTVLETGDHGSFNSWGRDRFWHPDRNAMDELMKEHPQAVFLDAIETNIIRNNRWRCDHGWDIDLDDGSSNYHIYNNLCLNGGIKLREGIARTVENNIIVNNSFHPHVWFDMSQDVFRHNIITTAYLPIQVKSWGKEIDYNFFIDPQGLMAAQKNGTDSHSKAGNPLFANPASGDYSIGKSSPALQTGFQNFDMNSFGVQYPKLKALAATPKLPGLLMPKHDDNSTESTYAWKGMTLKNVSTEGERSATGLDKIRGVMVLTAPSISDKALQPNDVILKINGKPVNNWRDMHAEIQKHKKRVSLHFLILRNQQEKNLTIR